MARTFQEQRFIEGVIGNLRLFGGIEPAQVAAVSRQSWVVPARRGDMLARRGEPLPGLFIVAYGLAKLALRGHEGGERVFRLVGAGQTFGEATSLLGCAAPYDALALDDAKAVVMPSTPLYDLMDREPRFGRAIARMLAERNFELIGEVEAVTAKRSVQRLAVYLVSLERDGSVPDRESVRLPVSKTIVAARLGIKKETLSRLLRRLAHDCVIRMSHREIEILDHVTLRRLAAAA